MSYEYLKFADDAAGVMSWVLVALMHRPVGYPAQCSTCRMTWPCDRRRRADEMKVKWEQSDV